MAMTPFIARGFSRIEDDLAYTRDGGRHRQRPRRTALALIAPLLVTLLTLLLLSFLGHSPSTPPVALPRPSSAAPKSGLHTKPVTGLPGVVCVGKHKTIARTPTKKDTKRIKRNAAKVRKQARAGKAPKMPSEITGHRLPNGTFSGSCLYGGQNPATVPPDSNY
jgi:hypothetical protein